MRPVQEAQLDKEEDAAVATMSVRGHEGPEGGELSWPGVVLERA